MLIRHSLGAQQLLCQSGAHERSLHYMVVRSCMDYVLEADPQAQTEVLGLSVVRSDMLICDPQTFTQTLQFRIEMRRFTSRLSRLRPAIGV